MPNAVDHLDRIAIAGHQEAAGSGMRASRAAKAGKG
jgi:hypothetical protein